MRRNNIYDVNYFWLALVFLHLAGSVVVMGMDLIPFGEVSLLGGICGVLFYVYRDKTNSIFYAIVAFALLAILLLRMPDEYHSSFLMNLLLFAFIVYTARCSFVSLPEYIYFRRITVGNFLCILLLTFCGIVISAYINGVSMIFFQNHTAASLSFGAQYKWESILVYAFLPAVVEEIIFRGCILRGIGGAGKGILVSAVLFALLHMNINQMCYALFMGLFFGVVVLVTGNVLSSLIMHFVFNLFSVLTAAFYDTAVVKWIYEIRIGEYTVFSPYFLGNKEQITELLLTGGILCVVTGVIVVLLLKWLAGRKKTDQNDEKTYQKNQEAAWKPDVRFFIGCLLCIIVAVILK